MGPADRPDPLPPEEPPRGPGTGSGGERQARRAQRAREQLAERRREIATRQRELVARQREQWAGRSREIRDRSREIAGEIKSQPPPREVQGMAAPTFGKVFAWPYRVALAILLRAGVTANQLTAVSLAMHVGIAVMLAIDWRFLPGILLIPAGLADIFDGGVARARGGSGPRGAWFDSVADRAADAAVLGGLFLSLASQGRDLEAALALAALATSLVVSYSRAKAQALGAQVGEGLFARLERSVALMAGLTAPGGLPWALGALVLLGGYTLVQRVIQAVAALRGRGE